MRAVTAALLGAWACRSASTPAPASFAAIDQSSPTASLLIAVSPVDDHVVWASGTRGTWVRTVDGGATWQSGIVAGAESLQFRDVHAVDAHRAYLLSIGNGDASRIYYTNDAGRTWTLQFTNPEPKAFLDCFDFWDARRGIAISDAVDGETRMIETADGGGHWTRVPAARLPAALPAEGSFAASGTCLITRPGGQAWIASGTPGSRLLHTADFGRTWSVDTMPVSGITSVAFRDGRHGIVLGFDSTAATAATGDGGKTWTRGGAPPFAKGVYGGVYVPGARRPTVVAVGPGGLAWSRDDGATWTVVNDHVYWSVAFASRGAGWAVGAGGRITKLSGF